MLHTDRDMPERLADWVFHPEVRLQRSLRPVGLHLYRQVRRSIDCLQWLCFWGAVLLPAVHLPYLAVSGVNKSNVSLLLILWSINAVMIVLGQGYALRKDARGYES